MSARMTGTAWGRGLQNALVISIGVLVALGLTTICLMFLFQLLFSFSLLISYLVFMGVGLLAFVTGWFYGRMHRGPVLHDCGTHPTRWLFFLNAALFLFLGLSTGAETFTENFNIYRTGLAAFFVGFSVYWLVMASGRLLVCENGLWLYWSLMPWHKIGSHEWKNDTLILQSNARFNLLKGAIPVSPVDQPAVEELLQQHVHLASEPPAEQPV